jgi:hypothetical protein
VLLLLLLLLQPTNGYVMPGYRRGSVAKLLTDICNRWVDGSLAWLTVMGVSA